MLQASRATSCLSQGFLSAPQVPNIELAKMYIQVFHEMLQKTRTELLANPIGLQQVKPHWMPPSIAHLPHPHLSLIPLSPGAPTMPDAGEAELELSQCLPPPGVPQCGQSFTPRGVPTLPRRSYRRLPREVVFQQRDMGTILFLEEDTSRARIQRSSREGHLEWPPNTGCAAKF